MKIKSTHINHHRTLVFQITGDKRDVIQEMRKVNTSRTLKDASNVGKANLPNNGTANPAWYSFLYVEVSEEEQCVVVLGVLIIIILVIILVILVNKEKNFDSRNFLYQLGRVTFFA